MPRFVIPTPLSAALPQESPDPNPHIALRVLQTTANNNQIALILLILHEKYKDEEEKSDILMTKSDIAKYSETSEETVVRVIGFFETQGILQNNGRSVAILDTKLLSIIAEGF